MVRNVHERILLIADSHREVEPVLSSAVPLAHVTRVDNYFDGIAELSNGGYTTVMAAAEPIERRPEAAVRTLRSLAGEGRIVLFGEPAMEAVSRKMLESGCDDYVVTPPNAAELQQIFGTPVMRIASPGLGRSHLVEDIQPASHGTPNTSAAPFGDLAFTALLLDAMLQHPGSATSAFVQSLNGRFAPWRLRYQTNGQPLVPAVDGMTNVSLPLVDGTKEIGNVHLAFPQTQHPEAAHEFLGRLTPLLAKVSLLEEQHKRLQQLAITDQLTQVYNRRYFEHFLAKILEKAKTMRFAVTLLLFDIDNFKKYNDEFGHGLGDEILRETAALMKRCSREHDLVARIGGDEFAVVFWEKESPRQPKDPNVLPSSRLPQEPIGILRRFYKLMTTQDFHGLGPGGRGKLTISGGLASYPWDGRNVQELVDAADHNLVQGAKKAGKNSIFLVGGGELPLGDDETSK